MDPFDRRNFLARTVAGFLGAASGFLPWRRSQAPEAAVDEPQPDPTPCGCSPCEMPATICVELLWWVPGGWVLASGELVESSGRFVPVDQFAGAAPPRGHVSRPYECGLLKVCQFEGDLIFMTECPPGPAADACQPSGFPSLPAPFS